MVVGRWIILDSVAEPDATFLGTLAVKSSLNPSRSVPVCCRTASDRTVALCVCQGHGGARAEMASGAGRNCIPTGAADVAAGVALLASVMPETAAVLEATMITSFTVLVWLSRVIANPGEWMGTL